MSTESGGGTLEAAGLRATLLDIYTPPEGDAYVTIGTGRNKEDRTQD